MTIDYDLYSHTLTVDGKRFRFVSETAYCAFVNDPNTEAHYKKRILPVYLREDEIKHDRP